MPLFRLFIVTLVMGGFLTACTHKPKDPDYWRREASHSALYLQGPKAQQQLEQSISQCVHEVLELAKLEAVRESVPPVLDPTKTLSQRDVTLGMDGLPRWNTPERLKALRVEHTEYHDFEGCMRHHGWQRVEFVDPTVKATAKDIYRDTAIVFGKGDKPMATVGDMYDFPN
jgi:hypothetical protein